MSIEIALFLLRLLAGLSLAGFLLALFIIIWRNMKQTEREMQAALTAHGYLIVQGANGEQSGSADERFPLHPISTFGRSASNSIVVDDDFVSAEHARIVLEQGHWWLEDCNSRNGTRLNGEAIAGRTILTDGDVIGIGNYRYRLDLSVEPASL